VAHREGAKPLVKVIDFGVARTIGPRPHERISLTEADQLLGTPEYMSPEQARSADIDTRTDIYSLGVVMYELLGGALPFDAARLRSTDLSETQRMICEVDPPRPSTRLRGLGAIGVEDVAARRRTTARVLIRELSGELEWIPLKAMRKDRDRRYR